MSTIIALFALLCLLSPTSAFAVSNTPTTASASTTGAYEVAIVGCGVLGTSLCKQLLASPDYESISVTGITKTKNNHESIMEQVVGEGGSSESSSSFHLETIEDLPKDKKFTNVVFCAPPSGFEDYPGAVKDAVDNLWAGSDSGSFVFTSSGGIYGPGNGEVVSETSPLPDATIASPRSLKLIHAEQNVVSSHGSVLRLAGLYTLDRGAHKYWLETLNGGEIKGSRDGIINLLHYDDAAGACLAALKAEGEGVRGKTFLVSDGHPTTRGGICESALKSKRYGDCVMPTFGAKDGEGEKGKIYDGSWTNEVLNWNPRYESFDAFVTQA